MPTGVANLEVSRSREGAWIEILSVVTLLLFPVVAPVRERGLKYLDTFWFFVPERGLKCNHAVPRLKNLKSLP